ncbi:MAG: toll/interleukin-1 receptor domain-containing protein [Proteobacteria bacterium]|nr:MAG: toll/interleukin-1 receptor domain-containing protein [Pseudomonadota bacterium]
MEYDVFISHASEDKDPFVRELARMLEEHQLSVWYDETSLKPGDSLRRSIDFGLARCRYGVVILSPAFLKKKWTQWELDGLVARQVDLEEKMLVPVWLHVSYKDVLNFSPPLADKVAINADIGLENVVRKIVSVVNPAGSTLVHARKFLYEEGFAAPIVTDDWWLDVVEYSGQDYLDHHYLSFNIPWLRDTPMERGKYIAQHALQMLWQEAAEEEWIGQLSHPQMVLDFIDAQPGLKKAAIQEPLTLAFFLPQLTIRGLGGDFEPLFDSLLETQPKHLPRGKTCEESIALRATNFGNYKPSALANIYFGGAGGGIGPSTYRYDQIDSMICLLSSAVGWMPDPIRNTLFDGLSNWAVWVGMTEHSYSNFKSNGEHALFDALYEVDSIAEFRLSNRARSELRNRIKHSKSIFNLPETVETLCSRFLKSGAIESFIAQKVARNKRNTS